MKPKLKDLNHPNQPVGFDGEGVARFKENAIVRWLVNNDDPKGGRSLNAICQMPFSNEDYTQLMQLIGYSVSGYGDLSSSPEETVDWADGEVERLAGRSTDPESVESELPKLDAEALERLYGLWGNLTSLQQAQTALNGVIGWSRESTRRLGIARRSLSEAVAIYRTEMGEHLDGLHSLIESLPEEKT